MYFFLAVLSGFLLGSISFGIIVVKLFKGYDIRQYGSGNTGFTNVLRVVGKGPAAIVLVGDILKGMLSVWIGFRLGGVNVGVAAGLAAMLGHTYPAFFGFRGGKGMATGLGVIITLAPDVTIIAVTVFLVTLFLSRYVSLGSILGALAAVIAVFALHKPLPIIIFAVAGAALAIYRHRSNMVRLYRGTENKIGKK